MLGAFALAVILGIVSGTITGLIPGLHVNTVVAMLIALSAKGFLPYDTSMIATYIMTMAVTHSVTEYIPTAVIGVPTSDDVMALIPAHKLFSEGRAYYGIVLSATSSLIGGIITILLFHVSDSIISFLTQFLTKNSVIIVLIALILLPILTGKSKANTMTVILAASLLGLYSLQYSLLQPMLAGLFGIPILIEALKSDAGKKEQKVSSVFNFINLNFLLVIAVSVAIGILFSYLPGAGPSSASLVCIVILPKLFSKSENIIALTSSLSTVNYAFSVYTMEFAGKARNGAVSGIMQLHSSNPNLMPILLGAMLLALVLSSVATFYLSRFIIRRLSSISDKAYRTITFLVILLNLILSFALTGILGLAFLFVSTLVGYYCLKKDVQKVSMLSSLMLPVILLYSGIA